MNNFEYYIETDSFICKYAKGKPAVRGIEFHEYDEAVLFLSGNIKFVSKEIQATLQPNDVVWIAREQFHQFIASKEKPYIRCIVAIKKTSLLAPVLSETINGVSVNRQNSSINDVFKKIINTLTSQLPKQQKEILLDALITQLVFERKQSNQHPVEKALNPSSFISRVISYIDENYDKNLTIKQIANELYISESNLSHRFRKELNISVYQYITEKRLSTIRQYVSSGYSIGHASILCGFNDYGNFYRICKSHYGVNPSKLLTMKNTNCTQK